MKASDIFTEEDIRFIKRILAMFKGKVTKIEEIKDDGQLGNRCDHKP